MNPLFLSLLALCLLPLGARAQERIYRCGNAYSNTVPEAHTPGCKLMEGGHITIIQGTRVMTSAPPASATVAGAPSAGQRVDASEQKTRDQDARKILEAELKKTELRLLELRKEYQQGSPDKRGDEISQPQKYQDRVAELKAGLARGEADLAGLRRELARLSTAPALTPTPVFLPSLLPSPAR